MIAQDLLIFPKTLTFATTFQCTAACKNCCFGCNPKIKQRLSLNEMKDYVNQAIENYGNNLKVLVLTGGECFLLKDDLGKIIEYGTSKGLLTRVVTNGYWAKSFKKAYLKLEKLKKLGLKELNLSTGDAHQEFVPFDNIVYAVVASLKLNLTTVVNVETNEIAKFSSETLKNDIRLIKYIDNKKLIILSGAWMPFTKSTEEKLNSAISDKPMPKINSKKRCKSLLN
jgi:MoaA/NifB/PqqE/SkfB family radical SAM enzyme